VIPAFAAPPSSARACRLLHTEAGTILAYTVRWKHHEKETPMVRRAMIGGFTLICLASVPLAAAATDDMEAQLGAMQERMSRLEARLVATEDQLARANQRLGEQHSMLEKAAQTGSSSGVSAFLESLEIGGWVSASYWYNLDDPSNDRLIGANVGTVGQSHPFSPDANQFSFDQLWFTLERPIDEDHRAGFFAEIAYGKTAGLLPNGNTPAGGAAGGNNLYLGSAYVQYLTDWGVTVKAGKFGTLIGAEVAQAPANFNISRGLVYNLLQPIDHVGVMASGALPMEGWDWGLAVVNDVFATQPTLTNGKAVMGHLGYATETWSANLTGIWGNDTAGDEDEKFTIIDVLLTWDPNERLSMWLNADYTIDDNDGGPNPGAYGIAVAGRYAWTDRLGSALRLEYVADDRTAFGFADEADLWSITATLDFSLTENLILKGEVRHDQGQIDKSPDHLFIEDGDRTPGSYTDQDQTVIGAQVIYNF
jgi:hypothetical protein